MFETKGIRSSATETYTIEELRVGLVAGSSLDTTASTALELPQPMAGAGGDTRSVHIRDTRAGHLWLQFIKPCPSSIPRYGPHISAGYTTCSPREFELHSP